MSNKKIFQELYSEKINKEDNYKAILNSIGRKEMKKIKWQWAFIPTCLILILIGIIVFNKNNIDVKKIKYNNDIIINSLEKLPNSTTDIDGKFEEKNIEEFLLKFNFIKNINVTGTSSRFGELYVRNNINDGNYSELYGYNMIYTLDENINKTIDIFFSETRQKRLSCLLNEFDLDKLKDSKINNTNVKIIKTEKWYIAKFEYDNLYFDIETYNLSEEEFIDLIESIINNNYKNK